MKTYKQFIAEAVHGLHQYGHWGVVDIDGNIHSGNAHPTARVHGELIDHLGLDQHETSDFFHDTETDTLNIRTHSPEGLQRAIEKFDHLPHGKTGKVNHEHFFHYDDFDGPVLAKSHSGKRYQVLPKMKKLADSI